MKTTGILISLLIICLLFTSFGGQVVQAAVNPSLYFTQQELDNLKALRTAPSHQALWNNIESWADAHVNDTCPSYFGGQNWNTQWDIADDIRIFIETMCFMYHMTDDPSYAESAKNWMLAVADWVDWDVPGGGGHWQSISEIGMGVAVGYYDFYDYLTENEREIIRNKLVTEVGWVYDRYSPFGYTYFPSDYPNHLDLVLLSIPLSIINWSCPYLLFHILIR